MLYVAFTTYRYLNEVGILQVKLCRHFSQGRKDFQGGCEYISLSDDWLG